MPIEITFEYLLSGKQASKRKWVPLSVSAREDAVGVEEAVTSVSTVKGWDRDTNLVAQVKFLHLEYQ